MTPPCFRQRLPFAALLTAAIIGIVAAYLSTVGAWVFVCVGLASLATWVFFRQTVWVLLAIVGAFGAAHLWQTTESPATALATMLGDGRVVATAEGVVAEEPVAFGKSRARFSLRANRIEINGRAIDPHAEILVVAPVPPPGRGDEVRVAGSLARIALPRNPSEFDARAWMGLRGITTEIIAMSPADIAIVKPASRLSLPQLADRCRVWMEATLRIGISGDPVICDLLAGMVLGITKSIPDNLQEQFRNTGTYHLFSVSGLHVGMIAVILWQILRIAGAGRRTAVCIVIPALFFYALITGWKPPSLRAATMSAIFLLGMVSSRQPVPLNSLCAAGFFLLVWRTSELFNPGFQLSFFVVFAIFLIAQPLRAALVKVGQPDPFVPRSLWTDGQKWLSKFSTVTGGLVAVSLAAWIGSLPLIIYYFHLISFSALAANLAIVPLAFVIMVTAILAFTGGLVSATLAAIFNNANWMFTHLLLLVVQTVSGLPGSFLYVGSPAREGTKVTVFDFGAGGATAMQIGGEIVFIDSGGKFEAQDILRPWLRSHGRNSPDAFVISHGDARHIGGASGLISGREDILVIDSPVDDRSSSRERLHRDLEAAGIPKSLYRAGDSLALPNGSTLHILHPPAGLQRNEADDKVLVARLDSGLTRVLFLSDAGLATQQWLLKNARTDLRANIVVAGRHRSRVPIDLSFLEAVNPSLVISTVSTFPANEPMDEDWARLVRNRGIRLFRQDQTGAVQLQILPRQFRATGFVDGQEFIASPEFKPARYAPSHR